MNLGMPEMIFIFLLALIIFGPKKMPEIGRQIGKALSEFKKASSEFQMQIEDEIRQLEYDEQTKKVAQATAPTLEGNVPSYAQSASAALVNAGSPEGTIAQGADFHTGDAPHDLNAGEGFATPAEPAPHETPAPHAQGSDV